MHLCSVFQKCHVLTVCEYTYSVCCLGKVKPFRTFKKLIIFKDILHELARGTYILDNTLAEIEKIISWIYAEKHFNSLHEARFEIFTDRCKPRNVNEILTSSKKLDGSSFLPCRNMI